MGATLGHPLRAPLGPEAALGDGSFARFALGGGTPTLLDEAALACVLDLAAGVMRRTGWSDSARALARTPARSSGRPSGPSARAA